MIIVHYCNSHKLYTGATPKKKNEKNRQYATLSTKKYSFVNLKNQLINSHGGRHSKTREPVLHDKDKLKPIVNVRSEFGKDALPQIGRSVKFFCTVEPR